MRVEPYTLDSYIHIIKRGARGTDIVRDEDDRWRFLRSLYFMNDHFFDKNWTLTTKGKAMFHRPEEWPKQEPLVEIAAYTLMPNHFHLLLREIEEGGVSKFMQKLGQSMTNYTNDKYQESGSLFQGAYRSKTIDSDEYLRYVSAYVMVKNTFELYPKGGLKEANENFEDAWIWARNYSFSSLSDYTGERSSSPILNKGLLGELWQHENAFKNYAEDFIKGGKWNDESKAFE